MIIGGGGNTAALVTGEGVVLVDTKNPGWGEAILDKVRTVTDEPVTMIINTHTHGDHVGSNIDFAQPVEVVAHVNTRTNMERMPAFQSASGQDYLPGTTYEDRLTLLDGANRSTSTTSAPATPAATPSWSSRASASPTPATCSRGRASPTST